MFCSDRKDLGMMEKTARRQNGEMQWVRRWKVSQKGGSASGARRSKKSVKMHATISRPLSPSPTGHVEEPSNTERAGEWGVW